MGEKLRKMASALGLRSVAPKDRRNVTPPNTTQPLDPEITPPGQIIDTATLESPPDAITITPLAAAIVTPPVAGAADKSFATNFDRMVTAAQREPAVFGLGVTGADLALSIFDGTSVDPKDYLIDLDTDSMERYPDVRSYFYSVGNSLQDTTTSPSDIEARKIYDDNRVRQGRLYIKAQRALGHGLFLDDKRDFLAYNVPGGRWYRMPIAGLVEDFVERKHVPMAEEGGFTRDPGRLGGREPLWEVKSKTGAVILTNIRSAIWWRDALRPGTVSGTRGWDRVIHSLYHPHGHPSTVMWSSCGGRRSIVDVMWLPDPDLFLVDRMNEVIKSDWWRKEDNDEYQESDDDMDDSPNGLVFDPAFLAKIKPVESKGFFSRFK